MPTFSQNSYFHQLPIDIILYLTQLIGMLNSNNWSRIERDSQKGWSHAEPAGPDGLAVTVFQVEGRLLASSWSLRQQNRWHSSSGCNNGIGTSLFSNPIFTPTTLVQLEPTVSSPPATYKSAGTATTNSMLIRVNTQAHLLTLPTLISLHHQIYIDNLNNYTMHI